MHVFTRTNRHRTSALWVKAIGRGGQGSGLIFDKQTVVLELVEVEQARGERGPAEIYVQWTQPGILVHRTSGDEYRYVWGQFGLLVFIR